MFCFRVGGKFIGKHVDIYLPQSLPSENMKRKEDTEDHSGPVIEILNTSSYLAELLYA